MQVSSAKDVTKDSPLSKKIDSAKMRQSQTPPKEIYFELNSLDCSRPRIPPRRKHALNGGLQSQD